MRKNKNKNKDGDKAEAIETADWVNDLKRQKEIDDFKTSGKYDKGKELAEQWKKKV